MIPGLIWAGVVIAWLAMEIQGLHKKHDRWPTFTDIVKRIRGDRSSPIWWMMLGFLGWMGWHFFVQ
jgi:hypothetical protein